MQAGVAMGLAKTVAVQFPEWGPEFATLMVICHPYLFQQQPACKQVDKACAHTSSLDMVF